MADMEVSCVLLSALIQKKINFFGWTFPIAKIQRDTGGRNRQRRAYRHVELVSIPSGMRRVSFCSIATGTAEYQDSRSDRSGQRRSAISLQCFALLNIGALLIVSFVAFLSATQPSDANLPLPKPSSNMLRGNVDLEASVRTSLIAVESMSPIQRTVADRTLPLEPPASKSEVTRAVDDAPVRSHATDGSALVLVYDLREY